MKGRNWEEDREIGAALNPTNALAGKKGGGQEVREHEATDWWGRVSQHHLLPWEKTHSSCHNTCKFVLIILSEHPFEKWTRAGDGGCPTHRHARDTGAEGAPQAQCNYLGVWPY